MSSITAEEAFNATNPDPTAYGLPADAPEDQVNAKREEAAQRIIAGVAANDAYWNSRPELEALKARAAGHGQVHTGEGEGSPTGVGSGTESEVIEGTATDEPGTALTTGGTGTGSEGGTPGGESDADRLRAQLRAAGQEPVV